MKKMSVKLLISMLVVSFIGGCQQTKIDEIANNKSENNSLIRETDYGEVEGVESDGIQIYYGIPYAKQPVDDLRWRAPEELEPWDDILPCNEETEIAMQMQTTYGADGNSETELKGTADALNLDIYTTEDAENKPVLVYIHGGNNQSGSSLEIRGNEIVENNDVVYVSINYRLGLLGFNSLPALLDEENNTGNFTLLDIAAALNWVNENIGNFGGDANNITVSGFSAGGRNVMSMLVSPLFEGLFNKAIVYSGGMTIADQSDSTEVVAELIAPLAIEDGRAANQKEAINWLLQDSTDVKDYLYSISDERLTALMTDAGIRMSLFPHLYGDGEVLPEQGFEDATFINDVPIMMLTGTTEFSMFAAYDEYLFKLGAEEDSAREFAIKYGSDLYRIFNTQLSAEKMSDTYKSDIYLAQVNYGDNNSLSKIEGIGSFHGIFVPMLTRNTSYYNFHDFSNQGYTDLAAKFNVYLKNFLYDSNPNGENAEVEWISWNSNQSTLLLDASEEEAKISVGNVYKTMNQVIEEMHADETLTEKVKLGVIKNIMNGRWFSSELDKEFSNTVKVELR